MSPRRDRRGAAGGPVSVGQELDRVLDGLGAGDVVERHAVFHEWAARVGPEIARVTSPHRVDGDTLIVHVRDSSWMSELSLRSRELLARVNEGRSRTAVKRLLFRLGDVEEQRG